MLSLLLRKRTVSTKAALKLLDDANAAIQYNREILQTALDHVRQGIAVFDKELQLICWNRQFGEILDLPPSLIRVGASLPDILRFNSKRNNVDADQSEQFVAAQIERYVSGTEPFLERFAEGVVIEVRANRMPDGGTVTTFTDITASVEAAEALERSNETLERRVRQRTEELTRLNAALAHAKGEAEAANISKTKFLAAASHDILQPLNAARLYVTSLIERGGKDDRRLVDNIDASLEAVEEILGALLDMSRLDTGALRPDFANFRVDELFRQIELEFSPLATSKGLTLTFVPCALVIRSDRRLLRRLIQNLVSNAIKYTPQEVCWWDAGGAATTCELTSTIMCRHSAIEMARHICRIPSPRPRRQDCARTAWVFDRRARGTCARLQDRTQIETDRGSHFSVTVRRSDQAPIELRAETRASTPASSTASSRFASTMSRRSSTAWKHCCAVGDASPRRRISVALTAISESPTMPNGFLVGRLSPRSWKWHRGHLPSCAGVMADLPAILITADRSPVVREQAREEGIQVLHKPIKPVALRIVGAMACIASGSRITTATSLQRPPFAAIAQLIFAAAITACVRLSTLSFCRMAETCAFTVASDTPSW